MKILRWRNVGRTSFFEKSAQKFHLLRGKIINGESAIFHLVKFLFPLRREIWADERRRQNAEERKAE